MKQFIFVCLLLISAQISKAQVQVNMRECNTFYHSSSGVAPAPWAIDGLVADWRTIFGPYSGNNVTPYTFPQTLSGSYDQLSDIRPDLDAPPANMDINIMGYRQDDYNLYFYLRKLESSNVSNSFYYFFDVNSDGFMNTGEPVIGAHFNAQQIGQLTLYKYVVNTTEDYVAGVGNWMVDPNTGDPNGYTIKGTVMQVFNAQTIPATYALGPNEIFKAVLTESGIGVELAIPWRFLRNWQTLSTPLNSSNIFSYHLALQKSAGNYKPGFVVDNGGFCCKKAIVIGFPSVTKNIETITNIASRTYRIRLKLTSDHNITSILSFIAVHFTGIEARPGTTIDYGQFNVTVYSDLNFNGVVDAGENPVIFQPLPGIPDGEGDFYYLPQPERGIQRQLGPYSSTGYIVDFVIPENIARISVNTEITIDLGGNFEGIRCSDGGSGGGKGINPTGFDLEPEEPETKMGREMLEPLQINSLRVYPNPSKGSVNILAGDWIKLGVIVIEDISGKSIFRKTVNSGETLTLHNLAPGLYIIRAIPTSDQQSRVVKLVVQ